jgi:OFA family oxalate/formate antiporter-like MFS transporter
MGYARSLPALYALYCLAGMGAAFVYSASMGSALKWFKGRRGLASGIMAAGFGGGTALFIPLISALIAQRGYHQTFLATGLVQGLVILLVAQFLRHPQEADPAIRPASQQGGAGGPQLTTLEMLRTPRFYAMYAMFVLMATGGLLVTASAGPMARSWGLSAGALTLATTLGPLANGASRIFWGWVSDRLGRETTMVIAFLLQALCLCLVVALGEHSGTWFALTLVLVYFTWGEIYALFPSATGDYFGSRHATSNYSVLYTAKGVASIIGGWFGAFLFERTGTWSFGFFGSALMALTAAVLAFRLRAAGPRRPVAVPVPAPAAK